MEYKSFIDTILQEASQIAREKFGKVSGITKPGDNNQVLTDADLAIGNISLVKLRISIQHTILLMRKLELLIKNQISHGLLIQLMGQAILLKEYHCMGS